MPAAFDGELWLADFAGQPCVAEQLSIAIGSAKSRCECLDNVLICGPLGIGKTALAKVIGRELGVRTDVTEALKLQRMLDLTCMLSSVQPRQVLAFDQIDRLQPEFEQIVCSVMEEFRLDLPIGVRRSARTHSLALPPFTLVGTTSREDLLSSRLCKNFGVIIRLGPYDETDLGRIVERFARLLDIVIARDAAFEIAHRSRGTPSVASRLLRRVRDYAEVRSDGRISLIVARAALALVGIDSFGLDEIDRKIMTAVIRRFNGGPVRIDALASQIDEQVSTIEECEPYLIRIGFLERTARGQIATTRAVEYFGTLGQRINTGKVSMGDYHILMADPPNLSGEPICATSKEDEQLNDALRELHALVGLASVKTAVRDLINLMEVRKRRSLVGLPVTPISLHRVFVGNPGTGKTTVARLLGKIFNYLGVLTQGHLIEVDRSGLVGAYIGQTALKTQAVIKRAMGGVLFIDEAYALCSEHSNDYGHEVISTLLKEMEDHRDKFIVIVAGYEEPMKKFLRSNPGFESRFSQFLNFEDYDLDQLELILTRMARDAGYIVPRNVAWAMGQLRALDREADRTFSNGRWVRNIFERAQLNHATRLSKIQHPSREQLATLESVDILGPDNCRAGSAYLVRGA